MRKINSFLKSFGTFQTVKIDETVVTKTDYSLELLENLDRRLARMENQDRFSKTISQMKRIPDKQSIRKSSFDTSDNFKNLYNEISESIKRYREIYRDKNISTSNEHFIDFLETMTDAKIMFRSREDFITYLGNEHDVFLF